MAPGETSGTWFDTSAEPASPAKPAVEPTAAAPVDAGDPDAVLGGWPWPAAGSDGAVSDQPEPAVEKPAAPAPVGGRRRAPEPAESRPDSGDVKGAVSPAVAARAGVAAARAAVARAASGQGRSAPTGPLPAVGVDPVVPGSVFDEVVPPGPADDRDSRHARPDLDGPGSQTRLFAALPPVQATGRHHRPA